jgi:hypothetical protein
LLDLDEALAGIVNANNADTTKTSPVEAGLQTSARSWRRVFPWTTAAVALAQAWWPCCSNGRRGRREDYRHRPCACPPSSA